MLVLSTTEL